jgi:hypothetical protein
MQPKLNLAEGKKAILLLIQQQQQNIKAVPTYVLFYCYPATH